MAVFLFTTSHVASKTHALIEKNLSHIDALSVSTTQQRAIIYKYTLQLIEKHPLLGVGPMHFAYAEPDILIKTDNLAAHPHNSILLILAEWGIPAGIFLLFFIMKTLFNFIKTAYHVNKNNYSDSNRKIIFASFAMSLGAGLLYSLVSGITVMPLPQTLLAVVAGSCVALYLQENPIEMSAVIRRKYIYITMLFFSIGFSVSTLTYHVVSTLPHLTQSEITWLEKRGLNTRFNPRFWLQGWLAEH